MTPLLIAWLILIALLAAGAVGVGSWIMRLDAREKRLRSRMELLLNPLATPEEVEEEHVSLMQTVKRSEIIKAKAAELINIDLNQTDTYPIKWWLIPPITIAVSYILIIIAAHPIGHPYFLHVVGWPALAFFVTKAVFAWMNNKRNGKLLEQFPDALSSIVRSVRVGIPMAEALRTVSRDALSPTREEFLILADKVSIGIPLDAALHELAIRIKLTEYQFFATALSLQARSGGGITATLETLAEVIRKRVALKARGYALTAEARTSAMILSLLPFIAGGGIFVMQRSYADLLFYTKGGQSCLGAAILLLIAGLGSIQYMINNVLK